DAGVFGPTATGHPLFDTYTSMPDPPYRMGDTHLCWLRAAVERGMEPMRALQSATRNIAEAYGVLDELGTLEVGKHADLVVLDADPLSDPASYARIAHVVKGGEIVDRDRLPQRRVLTVADSAASAS